MFRDGAGAPRERGEELPAPERFRLTPEEAPSALGGKEKSEDGSVHRMPSRDELDKPAFLRRTMD